MSKWLRSVGIRQFLSKQEIQFFCSWGYIIYPHFFTKEWCDYLLKALYELEEASRISKSVVPHPVFNELIENPSILMIAESILGEEFIFHHANGRILEPGCAPKFWHHDFDGLEPWNGTFGTMIHMMAYPSGLSEFSGSLGILPQSHRFKVSRCYPQKFGSKKLLGELNITGASGLLVIINSALWHTRREQRIKEVRPYFNLSYCQKGLSRPERSEYQHILQTLTRPGSLLNQRLMQLNSE